VDSVETETDVNVVPEEDEEGNQDPVQKDMSAVPSKRSRHSLADLLGPTYATAPAKKWKTAEDQAKEEISRYKEDAPLPLGVVNPLDWWKGNQSKYPFLSHMAKKYLCIPGTSVPSERVFSTAGDIITAQRSALTPEHVDQILFLNKNLKSK